MINQVDKRPVVLSIGGIDPSSGAGILADIKVFEKEMVYGIAVLSANTIQSAESFRQIKWTDDLFVLKQLKVVLKEFQVKAVKIGLIKDIHVLYESVKMIRTICPDAQIVWDPVLKSSTGFVFHDDWSMKNIIPVLKKVHLFTPNIPEIEFLYGELYKESMCKELREYCAVLIKGGHSSGDQCTDTLFLKNEKWVFTDQKIPGKEKRGTGCVLSSYIASELALGKDLKDAVALAKTGINDYIKSTEIPYGVLN